MARRHFDGGKVNYIELEMFDLEYILPGCLVDTGRLGPCIGVIVYDKQEKEAYANHSPDIGLNLEEMLTCALQKFQNPSGLDVYVAGGAIDYDDPFRDWVLECRAVVVELLKKYNFAESNVHIRWSPPESITNLRLNVDTAENELEVLDLNFETIYKGDIKKAPNPIRRV
jgi:hypothetical protein